MHFRIGDHEIAPGGRCFLIGEVAQAHEGSLGMAHAYIDAVATAGADAVKFQTHIADAESTLREAFRIPMRTQDASRRDYWRRMEFTASQWRELADHARERGIVFLSSPFSVEAVELLERLGVPAWKIASGEVENEPLIDRLVATGRPIFLSTGLTDPARLDALMARLAIAQGGIVLMQSTTAYPCPPERLGLPLVAEMRRRYGCPVGLSDHSGTVFAGLGCVLTGLDALEVHVTFSRAMFGPDVPASVTVEELAQLARGVRFLERARDQAVPKDVVVSELGDLRQLFGRSVVAARDLSAGTVLGPDHLACKKPGGGIAPGELSDLFGATLKRNVSRDEPLAWSDVNR